MSLGNKIVVILTGVVVLYAALDNALQRVMVSSRFEALEQDAAVADVQRIARGVQEEVDDLAAHTRRWANRDDVWRFAADRDEAFVASNLGDGALERQGVHLLFVLDREDRVVWGRVEDPVSRERIALREYPGGSLAGAHVALRHRVRPGQVAGLQRTEAGPMMIGSAPIHDGRGGGQEHGTLILGRFLDRATTDAIGARMGAGFAVWDIDGALPPAEEALRDELTAAAVLGEPVLEPVGDDLLCAYSMLPDVLGNPVVLLRADIDRAITRSGAAAVDYALLSTIATALLIFTVLLHVLRRIVVRPVEALTAHAVRVGQSDDTSARICSGRDDEIGQLSDELDGMMERLDRSREQLSKASRLAGMSEIATGVIHNVGNVLNSVSVSASVASRKAEQLATCDLTSMYRVLDQNRDRLGQFLESDPRGVHFLPFMEELAGQLDGQRTEILQELRGLGSGLEHIVELVRAQQAYAGNRGVLERADLAQLVEEALKITRQSCWYTTDVELVREYGELPMIPVDRNKLLDVLVNLVQNAAEAMAEVPVARRRLVLRITSPSDEVARIEVRDHGVGIPRADLARVFQHGFTTKEDGHGFGLHSAANAATEMGARLDVRSDGPGRGATFVLDLPMSDENLARAA